MFICQYCPPGVLTIKCSNIPVKYCTPGVLTLECLPVSIVPPGVLTIKYSYILMKYCPPSSSHCGVFICCPLGVLTMNCIYLFRVLSPLEYLLWSVPASDGTFRNYTFIHSCIHSLHMKATLLVSDKGEAMTKCFPSDKKKTT